MRVNTTPPYPPSTLVACTGLGKRNDSLRCCTASDFTDPTCHKLFSRQGNQGHMPLLQSAFSGPGHADMSVANCTNTKWIYSSLIEDNGNGNGRAPRDRFAACVNMPAIARASSSNLLPRDIAAVVDDYVPKRTTEQDLEKVTAAVTDCLSSTCRHSRHGRQSCYHEYCAPTKLLTNSTSPNITAVNNCLNRLCQPGLDDKYGALPYADADVVGIGVFVSYLMQCALLLLILGLLLGASLWGTQTARSRRSDTKGKRMAKPDKEMNTFESSIRLLDSFHKAQCYFMGSLMVAALSYDDIFEKNNLVVFMMIPLTTNGVLPVVFAYLLLVYYRESTKAHALLTLAVYTISSAVYWILYRQFDPRQNGPTDYRVYQQFMYKASDIPACGGYSGLAVCPPNTTVGFEPVKEAAKKVHYLTPIIWTVSTVILVGLMMHVSNVHGLVPRRVRRGSKQRGRGLHEASQSAQQYSELGTEKGKHSIGTKKFAWRDAVFGFLTVICLAGMGMQLSLLTIAKSLHMMNTSDWSFGQIVAVTVWVPSLLEYAYGRIGYWLASDNHIAANEFRD